jgi:hypothetical protein
MQFAENDLDNRIPAGHAAFLNSFPYTRLGYTSLMSRGRVEGGREFGVPRT